MHQPSRDHREFHGVVIVEPPLTGGEREWLRHPSDLPGTPPKSVCGWVVCDRGCCLAVDPGTTVRSATAWIRYLIRHRLGEDHTFDGVILAAERSGTETAAVRVRGTKVERIRLSSAAAGTGGARVISLASRRKDRGPSDGSDAEPGVS